MNAIFGLLAVPFGYLMQGIYYIVQNYGITIIIFTFIVRLVMLPLRIKQQKSSARQMAYQPMIQEIQNKWKNDKKRQQEEMMKFQEESGIKMSAGCLPMVLDMLVMFSIIQVIYKPLQYILHLNKDAIAAGIAAIGEMGRNVTDYTGQSFLIGEIINKSPSVVQAVSAVDGTVVDKILNFNFNFLGLNLAVVPDFSMKTAPWQYLIIPILSIVTMFASQFIIMKTTGSQQQQGKGMMWIMTLVMGVMFGSFAFTVPVGFSLYYTTSNVVSTVVQLIVRKIIDPEKIKEQLLAEIEENRKAKRAVKKHIEVVNNDGVLETKSVTEAELAKLRLEKARKLDEIKYGSGSDDEADNEKVEKARQIDENKYKAAKTIAEVKEETEQSSSFVMDEIAAEQEQKETEKTTEEAQALEYKPGRRMRERQKKQDKKED